MPSVLCRRRSRVRGVVPRPARLRALNLYTDAPSDYDGRVRDVFDDPVADSLPIEPAEEP